MTNGGDLMVQVNADLWPVTLEEARFHRYAGGRSLIPAVR